MATRKDETGGAGKKVTPKGRKTGGGKMAGQLARIGGEEGLVALGTVYDCPRDCDRLTVIVKNPRAAIDRLTVTL